MAAQGFAMLSWPLSRSRRALLFEPLDERDEDQIAALAGGLEVRQTMTWLLQKRTI
jgi:hypothetical protein